MKKIVILSGGLDSTICLYKTVKEMGKKNTFALSFDYNQKHKIELQKANISTDKLGVNHKIIDIGFFGHLIKTKSALSGVDNSIAVPSIQDVLGHPQPITYVPFRNGLFSMLAFSYAECIEAERVVIGLQAHDLYQYWDTTLETVQKLNQYATLNREILIQIEAPFVNMSKAEEIKLGVELKVPFEDTWTCYDPQPIFEHSENHNEYYACGKCPSCAERIQNFELAGVKDPINYV
jgi:7-cyano-7-deazaguanine synthase